MEETRGTNWDVVRVRCSVIGNLRPGLVTVRSEALEVQLDEDLLHWDSVYWGAMAEILRGADFDLPTEFVPPDLRRANATFWFTIGNDCRRRLFRRPEDAAPASIGPPPAR